MSHPHSNQAMYDNITLRGTLIKDNAKAIAENPALLDILKEWIALGHDLRCRWYMGDGCCCGCDRAKEIVAMSE